MKTEIIKRTIFYHTQVYFLDAAIEYVRLLASQGHKVHVAIEISPNQLKTNILNIDTDLNNYLPLTSFNEVVDTWRLKYLEDYFTECESVNFVVYPSKKIKQTRKVAKVLGRFINKINPDYIHLDDFSSRTLFQLPFLIKYRKILIANIHDPLTHSGEFNLSREVYRKLWFNLIPNFAVFSEFSKTILLPQLRKSKRITVLKLLPYTVYKSFLQTSYKEPVESEQHISFVGRISPYKGVEMFVKAIEELSVEHDKVHFHIGGKTIKGYNPEFLSIKRNNLSIDNKFLSNREISEIINRSQLIVCPYKDATQSGVIMTAFALGCPVLVTNTGGLPEYILHNRTGIICTENSSEGIALAIDDFLKSNLAPKLSKNIISDNYELFFEDWNKTKIKQLYGNKMF